MAQWSGSESGILRKNKPKDNYEDLLVFGYACKVFRDDEKALNIDQGKHLIPWMGDDSLKIDRYDCRGFLSDVKSFEAGREGFDTTRWLGLNDNERRIEQLCDEERYYSLKINEEEEKMYKEEEIKRSRANEFQYNYDVPMNPEPPVVLTVPEADDEEYVPPIELDVPVDIALPKTVRENTRIEKTASFVAQQGPQMEILIKAKQADNPHFGFLNHLDPLYKFYKHVLMAIKSGRYRPKSEQTEKEARKSESESGDEHYLHPSLVSSSTAAAPSVPTIPYRPSENCAYSQLVNKIQGNQPPETNPTAPTYDQYYQYYMTQHYYEFYKQFVLQHFGDHPPQEIDANTQTYIQQLFYAQYMQQQQQPNPYAQIVSNLAEVTKEPAPEEKIEAKPSLLTMMQQYVSTSEESEDETKEPTDELKTVIEKMASYVAKNGDEFEEIVRSRNDPRFEFLKATHEFYSYYRKRLKELTEVKKEPKKNGDVEKPKPKENKIAPVSFSIKKLKEETVMELKSALPMEESSEEEVPPVPENTETKPVTPVPETTEQPAIEENGTKESEPNGITDDPILEMIDLTNETNDKKDETDKSALQLERKRKALEFLRMKVAPDPGSPILIEDRTSADSSASSDEDRKRRKKRSRKKDRRSRREPEEKGSHKKKKSHKRKHSKSKKSVGRKKSKKKRPSESSHSSSSDR